MNDILALLNPIVPEGNRPAKWLAKKFKLTEGTAHEVAKSLDCEVRFATSDGDWQGALMECHSCQSSNEWYADIMRELGLQMAILTIMGCKTEARCIVDVKNKWYSRCYGNRHYSLEARLEFAGFEQVTPIKEFDEVYNVVNSIFKDTNMEDGYKLGDIISEYVPKSKDTLKKVDAPKMYGFHNWMDIPLTKTQQKKLDNMVFWDSLNGDQESLSWSDAINNYEYYCKISNRDREARRFRRWLRKGYNVNSGRLYPIKKYVGWYVIQEVVEIDNETSNFYFDGLGFIPYDIAKRITNKIPIRKTGWKESYKYEAYDRIFGDA